MPRYGEKTRQVSIRFPESLLQWVEAQAGVYMDRSQKIVQLVAEAKARKEESGKRPE